jgi:predicted DNA-binding transcriptional regulator AlpA
MSELVDISDAADYLGVSRTTLYKYIERGLETVGEKNNQKIPRFMLEAWKNPEIAFQMQWLAQLKRTREQTVEQRLDDVNKQIAEFEKKFGGSFYFLFSNMTDQELDAHPEAVDLHDWRELETEKQELLGRLREER